MDDALGYLFVAVIVLLIGWAFLNNWLQKRNKKPTSKELAAQIQSELNHMMKVGHTKDGKPVPALTPQQQQIINQLAYDQIMEGLGMKKEKPLEEPKSGWSHIARQIMEMKPKTENGTWNHGGPRKGK